MISAMPAVALRREKKRSKPGLNRASSAASFGGQAKDQAGRNLRASSVSTLDIPQRIVRFKSREQEQREKLFMYCGTLCLVTGLFLLFIGVGVQVTPTRTVGLLFIALGAFLCFLKVVTTPEEPRRAPLRRHRPLGSSESLYNLAVPGITVREGETEITAPRHQASKKIRRKESGKKEEDQENATPKQHHHHHHHHHHQQQQQQTHQQGSIHQQQMGYISVAIEEPDDRIEDQNGTAPIAKMEE